MTTDMPEVIWAGDYDEETLSVTAYDHAVGNYQKYISSDKHEELKAIAESMYRALQLTKSDAEKNGFKYGRQSNCVKALTEYNKYKGG